MLYLARTGREGGVIAPCVVISDEKIQASSTVYVPLICSESPPLLSRAVCVLKITHAVYYFAKEKEKNP